MCILYCVKYKIICDDIWTVSHNKIVCILYTHNVHERYTMQGLCHFYGGTPMYNCRSTVVRNYGQMLMYNWSSANSDGDHQSEFLVVTWLLSQPHQLILLLPCLFYNLNVILTLHSTWCSLDCYHLVLLTLFTLYHQGVEPCASIYIGI